MKLRRNGNLLLSFLSLFILFTVSVAAYAETDPWKAYEKYIPEETPVVKREFRAVWICTVGNLDWPSAETRMIADDALRIEKSKEEMIAILDQAAGMNMNAVFFQVGPTADAFYASEIVPWSSYLTGVFGKDPGFDPLAFVIEEAHKRNLEVHAWFNPYRVSMDVSAATVSSLNIEKSVYIDHPEWIRKTDGRFFLDPGIPEVRQWVIDRVMEVVYGYDIDGVHFDDYFYSEDETGEMDDEATYAVYNNGQFTNMEDWRRNNTYLLIKELSEKIRTGKSWVKFGVSPIAIWENKSEDFPEGSDTVTSYTSYSRMFADTKKWVEEELVDYIAPQIYFTFANTRAPYGVLADWWTNVCKGRNVHLYIGQALYKVNCDADKYFNGDNALKEFSAQLKYNATREGIDGSIVFRMSSFQDDLAKSVTELIGGDLWKYEALVPVMEWKGGCVPDKPSKGLVDKYSRTVKISWSDTDPDTAYFAIYRYKIGEKIDLDSDQCAAKLIGKVRKNTDGRQEYVDTGLSDMADLVYVVTSLDRLHNESDGLEIGIDQSEYFYDVGKSQAWAVSSIDYLFKREIVYGDGQGYFYPANYTRRADFVLMLARAFGLTADFDSTYDDVPAGSYYYTEVSAARALGITPANDSKFRPFENITREEMFVMMFNVLEYKGIVLPDADPSYLFCYSDYMDISEDAKDAAAQLTEAGLMAGTGDRANPKAYSTRAEIAVVLFRMIVALESGKLG